MAMAVSRSIFTAILGAGASDTGILQDTAGYCWILLDTGNSWKCARVQAMVQQPAASPSFSLVVVTMQLHPSLEHPRLMWIPDTGRLGYCGPAWATNVASGLW